MVSEILKASHSRVFLVEDGAGPNNTPEYMGRMRAGATGASGGALTPVFAPSPDQYGRFDIIDKIRGTPDLPSLTLEARMSPREISDLLRMTNKGCAFDVHLHFGECADPSDFDFGWEWKRIVERSEISTYSTSDLGVFDPGDEEPLTESIDVQGDRMYDVKKLFAGEQAAALVTDELVDIVICDAKTCGECGISSDGCQVAFALVNDSSGSPGLPARVLYTEDGGATWAATPIASLGLAETPNRLVCSGQNLFVISEASGSMHYASILDILAGEETWAEITTGFNGSGAPRAVASVGRTATWIVGAGGYVYFASDLLSGVEEQSSGSATTEDLNAIDALDSRRAVAVGNANALLHTENGGVVWSLVTGPAVGVNLLSVAMLDQRAWLVGTADGRLFYTRNAGVSWTEKTFPGSGAGEVTDIEFASRNVGYIAHNTAAPAGRILRTTNGGASWVVLPEESGVLIPANDGINAIAACRDDVNVVFGAGLAADGSDGFLVKFA